MSIARLLSHWRAEPSVGANIVAWKSLPQRVPQSATLPEGLHPDLRTTLQRFGIDQLYTHQAACWNHAQAGANIVIATGTASGKTLGYNLPVLDHLLRNPNARALFLFPTKALAQDQLAVLRTFDLDHSEIKAAIYDGDTPQHARSKIRNEARLILTNPDMLHVGILPHHTHWIEFFGNLRYVIIDEMHIYRGVFGSHVANVMRRLKRIASNYGSHPQFILTSATIANPDELARKLIEAHIELIDQDGSASGRKEFLIYNPPVVDRDLGIRASALQESVRLAEDLLSQDVQTLIFGRSRRSVEIALTYLRQRAGTLLEQPSRHIRGYRSGYLPRERREIEQGLRDGSVRVAIATNALELGIDIGGLDAIVLIGYPGSIAATWQQAGRAGRGEQAALAVLVATADPLDQFLASHPEYFFERSPENALINPDNLLILLEHLRCAAFEIPFEETERFGDVDASLLGEFLELLQSQGVLHHSGDKYFWMTDQYPAQGVSLRSASPQTVNLQIYSAGVPQIIGQVDGASAHWLVHEQAIYMHEGLTYLVEQLDLDSNLALLEPISADYYTIPRRDSSVQLIELFEQQPATGSSKAYGEIQVTSQVTGYRKVRWYTHETLGYGEVDLPPTELLTTGYWLTLDELTVEKLRDSGMWRSDPNKYGPDWDRQRSLARERDEYRCKVCGLPERERSHDVHHVVPFRQFSSPNAANRLGNLVTLCPSCHRKAESAVRVRTGLGGLAFVLGHLAPLFLMCETGDLGVHADPKLELADKQPGVVLYDQTPAGIGFSQWLFELHDDLITQALTLVASCKCQDGCPSCVGPGGEHGMGGKSETIAILKALSNQPQ